jgi:hypothetical protein
MVKVRLQRAMQIAERPRRCVPSCFASLCPWRWTSLVDRTKVTSLHLGLGQDLELELDLNLVQTGRLVGGMPVTMLAALIMIIMVVRWT